MSTDGQCSGVDVLYFVGPTVSNMNLGRAFKLVFGCLSCSSWCRSCWIRSQSHLGPICPDCHLMIAAHVLRGFYSVDIGVAIMASPAVSIVTKSLCLSSLPGSNLFFSNYLARFILSKSAALSWCVRMVPGILPDGHPEFSPIFKHWNMCSGNFAIFAAA